MKIRGSDDEGHISNQGCLSLQPDPILIKNLMMISQDTSNKQFDGFPFVLVMFDIINKAIDLLRPQRKVARQSKYNVRLYRNHKNDQMMFDKCCEQFYDGNVYRAFNDFIFHFLLTFITSWKHGITEMQNQFEQ